MSREKPTQIIPTPADEALCDWLTQRYSGDEYANRIQVCQWISNQRGEVVFTHDQKLDSTAGNKKAAGKPKLTREKLVEISNRVVAAAQADCDSLRHSTVYAVLAFHPLMGPDSYARHLLRCAPKNALTDGGSGEDMKVLLLGLLNEERRDRRWCMEQALNAMSGVGERDAARIEKMEAMLDGRLEKETKFIEATESALSRAEDRKIKNAWGQLKIAGVRDGIALLKGLLPATAAALTSGKVGVEQAVRQFMGSLTRAQIAALVGSETLQTPTGGILNIDQAILLKRIDHGETALIAALFQALSPDQLGQLQQVLTQDQLVTIGSVTEGLAGSNNDADGAGSADATRTAEQKILDKFLTGCESAGIDLKLCGDWQAENGELQCTTPGVLTPDQVLVLLRVHRGTLPAAALDDLLPTSGKPLAISPEQQAAAIAIMPQTIAASLGELIAIRQRATKGEHQN